MARSKKQVQTNSKKNHSGCRRKLSGKAKIDSFVPEQEAIDRLYRKKDIKGLIAKLFGCIYVKLTKEGISFPMCCDRETTESNLTAGYILNKIKALPGGKLALANLVRRFKNGQVTEHGVKIEDQKKADELYHRKFMNRTSEFFARRSPD